MAHKNWSDVEVLLLKKLRKTKMTLKEISEVMGRSRNSVGAKIVKLRQNGVIKVKVPQWTREDDNKLTEWVDQGLLTAFIANKLNRSIQAVVVRKKLLGLGTKGDNFKPNKEKIQTVKTCPEVFWNKKMKGKTFLDVTFKRPIAQKSKAGLWT